ncbi:MAG: hypothetical protein PUF45_10045 [Lachnospiraceae bacterium]|nr:hypothetical protein [Lachnospiraceae bacterium]
MLLQKVCVIAEGLCFVEGLCYCRSLVFDDVFRCLGVEPILGLMMPNFMSHFIGFFGDLGISGYFRIIAPKILHFSRKNEKFWAEIIKKKGNTQTVKFGDKIREILGENR